MADKTETWFHSLSSSQQPKLKMLRRLILAADDRIVEEIKWDQPCYRLRKPFCYLQKAASHVTIGFQQGAHLPDPDEILQGEGKDMRHVKIHMSDDIDEPAIKGLIEQALAFEIQ